MNRTWGKSSSRLLHFFRVETRYFRGKARVFRAFRRATGRPRLTIRYGQSGWITVDDEGELIERYVWLHGLHEPEVIETIKGHLHHDEVVWDIGANVGTTAIPVLCDHRVAELHCFEPIPDVARRLEQNLSLNGSNYFVHELAVSDVAGSSMLYLANELQPDMASLTFQRGTDSIEVRTSTVDTLIAAGLSRPTIVKIDVEGVEEAVLDGAVQLLDETPPKLIVFETECDQFGAILNCNISRKLSQFGYRIDWIRRRTGKLHFNEGRYWENYAAVRIL